MPTMPRRGDMRMEPSLNVTPEGSLADIPPTIEREKKSRRRTVRNFIRNNLYGNS